MATIFRNVQVITPFVLRDACVVVEGKTIRAVCGHIDPAPGDAIIDGKGLYLSPGFIDLHVHGGGGRSVMEGTADAIVQMGNAHAAYGTTSLLPTTLSMPLAAIAAAADSIQAAMQGDACQANLLGIHFEGPCLSPKQSGAQATDDLLIPATADLSPLDAYWPITRMMGIAPELDGAYALGDFLATRGIVASVAHSDATYDEVHSAASHGFADVTHLYSSCSTVVRKDAFRIPGVVEAGLNLDALTVQVIADGCHLPLSLLQLIYRCKGSDGMYAITDGLEFSATHIQDGTVYTQQNGMQVIYEDGVMKLPDRTAFAGSVGTMNRMVHTLRKAGIPLTDAVRMATDTPAQRVGALSKGRIAPGYDADLVLFDGDLTVHHCMINGTSIHTR